MPSFTQNSQRHSGAERSLVIKQTAFIVIGVLLAAVGIYLAKAGGDVPIKFLFSGEVFVQEFKFIDDGNYVSGDGFRVAVNRVFLFSIMLTAVLLLILNVWRITAQPFAGARRIIFMTMSVAFSLVPLACALVGTIMVIRLTMNLGVTPKRLLGIATGMAIVSAFPIFFWATFRKREPTNPQSTSSL